MRLCMCCRPVTWVVQGRHRGACGTSSVMRVVQWCVGAVQLNEWSCVAAAGAARRDWCWWRLMSGQGTLCVSRRWKPGKRLMCLWTSSADRHQARSGVDRSSPAGFKHGTCRSKLQIRNFEQVAFSSWSHGPYFYSTFHLHERYWRFAPRERYNSTKSDNEPDRFWHFD